MALLIQDIAALVLAGCWFLTRERVRNHEKAYRRLLRETWYAPELLIIPASGHRYDPLLITNGARSEMIGDLVFWSRCSPVGADCCARERQPVGALHTRWLSRLSERRYLHNRLTTPCGNLIDRLTSKKATRSRKRSTSSCRVFLVREHDRYTFFPCIANRRRQVSTPDAYHSCGDPALFLV